MLLAHRLVRNASQRSSCETTYIYEGYETVGLPASVTDAHPLYRLVRYVDHDPRHTTGECILCAARPAPVSPESLAAAEPPRHHRRPPRRAAGPGATAGDSSGAVPARPRWYAPADALTGVGGLPGGGAAAARRPCAPGVARLARGRVRAGARRPRLGRPGEGRGRGSGGRQGQWGQGPRHRVGWGLGGDCAFMRALMKTPAHVWWCWCWCVCVW